MIKIAKRLKVRQIHRKRMQSKCGPSKERSNEVYQTTRLLHLSIASIDWQYTRSTFVSHFLQESFKQTLETRLEGGIIISPIKDKPARTKGDQGDQDDQDGPPGTRLAGKRLNLNEICIIQGWGGSWTYQQGKIPVSGHLWAMVDR